MNILMLLLCFLTLSHSCGYYSQDEKPKNIIEKPHVNQNNQAQQKEGEIKPKQENHSRTKNLPTAQFEYDFEGQKLAAVLSIVESSKGLKGIINVLDLPETVPVSLASESESKVFKFIYSEKNKQFNCSLPEGFDFVRMLKAAAFEKFGGVFKLDWLNDQSELAQAIFSSAKRTEIYKSKPSIVLAIERPEISITISNFADSASRLVEREKEYLRFRIKKIFETGSLLLFNSEICDLVAGDIVFLKLKGNEKESSALSINYKHSGRDSE